ncbi:MAG: hypothetical protein JST17_08690, partial [Bacteroidetes bacterium]|nr:hypothetical protein [Bacteroidota bacterium]
AAGCDSVVTLHFFITSAVTGDTTATVCQNQLPFLWHGQSLSTANDYTTTLRSAAGCDSVVTLHFFVTSAVTGDTTATVCQNQLPFLWHGQSLSTANNYTTTLRSAAGCDSVVTLHFFVVTLISKEIDTTVCTNAIPFVWNGISVTGIGNYLFTTASAAGCDSITTLHVTVAATITKNIDTTVCTNAIPFAWNGISVIGIGNYSYSTTSSAGCDSITTLNVTLASLIAVSVDTTVCTNTVPFTWNGQAVTGSGSYTFTTTSSSGCDSTITLRVTVNTIPSPMITGPVIVCQNSTGNVYTTETGYQNYTWNIVGGTITSGGGINDNTVTVTWTNSGSQFISVNYSNGRCAAITSTTLNITVNPAPGSFNVSGGGVFCSLNGAVISLSGSETGIRYELLLDGVAVSTLPITGTGGPISFPTQFVAGIYTIIAVDPVTFCTSLMTGSANITFNTSPSKPVISHGSTTICEGASVILIDPSVNTNSIQWNLNGSPISGATSNTHSATVSGSYTVTETNSNGCTAISDPVVVVINPVINITIDTSVCLNAVPFTWNGVSITGAGNYPFTTRSAAGCDSITTLHVTVAATITKDIDTTVCANAIPFTWNGVSITGAGNYPFTTRSTAGCDSITTLHVTVAATITKDIDTTVCANAVPFTWNGVSITGAGNYPFTTRSTAGCDSITTLHVTVAATITKDIDTTVCANAVPFTWNGVSIT